MSAITRYALRAGLFATLALSAGCFSVAAKAAPDVGDNNSLYLRGGGGDYSMKVTSFLARRFNGVIKQKYDFSCGSAAVATLLSYHYDHPIDEISVLDAMYEHGQQEKIKKEGFSLLDMKTYLNSIGYEAEGFRESLDKLKRVGIPAIVLINKKNFLHFVVVKGVDDKKVSVGDPTLGLTFYDREEFEAMWNGILFVITNHMEAGRGNFNDAHAWKPYGISQFRNALSSGQLSSVTLNTAYSPGYY